MTEAIHSLIGIIISIKILLAKTVITTAFFLFAKSGTGQNSPTNPFCSRDTIQFEYNYIVGGFAEESMTGLIIRQRKESGNSTLYIFKDRNELEVSKMFYVMNRDSIIHFYQKGESWVRDLSIIPDNSIEQSYWQISQMLTQCEFEEHFIPYREDNQSKTYIHSKRILDSLKIDSEDKTILLSFNSLIHTGELISERWKFELQNEPMKPPSIIDSILLNIPLDQFSSKTEPNKLVPVDLESDFKSIVFYSFDSSMTEIGLTDLIDSGKVNILDFWYIGCKHCHNFQSSLNKFMINKQLCDSVNIIRVNAMDRSIERINEFFNKHSSRYSCGSNKDVWYGYKSLYEAGYTTGYPLIILINKKGDVAAVYVGNNPRILKQLLKLTQEN